MGLLQAKLHFIEHHGEVQCCSLNMLQNRPGCRPRRLRRLPARHPLVARELHPPRSIYPAFWLALPFLRQIEAIYHTSIVVAGSEFYFGGGINVARAGHTPFGRPVQVGIDCTRVPCCMRSCLRPAYLAP